MKPYGVLTKYIMCFILHYYLAALLENELMTPALLNETLFGFARLRAEY